MQPGRSGLLRSKPSKPWQMQICLDYTEHQGHLKCNRHRIFTTCMIQFFDKGTWSNGKVSISSMLLPMAAEDFTGLPPEVGHSFFFRAIFSRWCILLTSSTGGFVSSISNWSLKQLQSSKANFFVKQRPFPTHLLIHPLKSLLTLLRCSDPGGKILLVLWMRVISSLPFSAFAIFFEIRQTWLRRVSAWDLFREGMAGTLLSSDIGKGSNKPQHVRNKQWHLWDCMRHTVPKPASTQSCWLQVPWGQRAMQKTLQLKGLLLFDVMGGNCVLLKKNVWILIYFDQTYTFISIYAQV